MKQWYFEPVLFSIGPLEIRWYGLMYVVGFLIGGYLIKRLAKEGLFKPGAHTVDSLITYALIGMFIGSRSAYVFIYNWDYYSQNLSDIFSVWKGGLSFHGAVVGLALGCYVFARKHKVPFLMVSDCGVTGGAQGILFGRIGNFINGELYGRVTDSPLGVVFPGAGPYPRHASQLYEGVAEGVVLFLFLWFTRKKYKHYGILSAIFFSVYAVFRYFIEFFREPDSQLGYYFGGTTTMGQILCFIQIFVGIGIYLYARKRKDVLKIDLSAKLSS